MLSLIALAGAVSLNPRLGSQVPVPRPTRVFAVGAVAHRGSITESKSLPLGHILTRFGGITPAYDEDQGIYIRKFTGEVIHEKWPATKVKLAPGDLLFLPEMATAQLQTCILGDVKVPVLHGRIRISDLRQKSRAASVAKGALILRGLLSEPETMLPVSYSQEDLSASATMPTLGLGKLEPSLEDSSQFIPPGSLIFLHGDAPVLRKVRHERKSAPRGLAPLSPRREDIAVLGEVVDRTSVRYVAKKHVDYYIDQAGGCTGNADARIYLIDPVGGGGTVIRKPETLLQTDVPPGATIIVARDPLPSFVAFLAASGSKIEGLRPSPGEALLDSARRLQPSRGKYGPDDLSFPPTRRPIPLSTMLLGSPDQSDATSVLILRKVGRKGMTLDEVHRTANSEWPEVELSGGDFVLVPDPRDQGDMEKLVARLRAKIARIVKSLK